jgi:hypothetical protein
MGKRTAVSVAIAAAGSVDEDAALRRRVQYKIYQRQHRARQKNKTLRLEHDVAALRHEIERLATQHAALSSRNRSVFQSRGTLSGAPAQAVAEFYRVFAYGHNDAMRDQQAQFMRAIMATDVRGPDFTGVEPLIDQWQIYGALFDRTVYDAKHLAVETYDEGQVIVVVDVVMTIQPTRHGAMILYPSVVGDERAIQSLVARPFQVGGTVRFMFDETGTITWFGADMDFVAGLAAVLGSATRVSTCIEDANMSLCTGRISLNSYADKPRTH